MVDKRKLRKLSELDLADRQRAYTLKAMRALTALAALQDEQRRREKEHGRRLEEALGDGKRHRDHCPAGPPLFVKGGCTCGVNPQTGRPVP